MFKDFTGVSSFAFVSSKVNLIGISHLFFAKFFHIDLIPEKFLNCL